MNDEDLDAQADEALRLVPNGTPATHDTTPMAWDLTRFAIWMRSDPVRFEKFIFMKPVTLAAIALEYTGE